MNLLSDTLLHMAHSLVANEAALAVLAALVLCSCVVFPKPASAAPGGNDAAMNAHLAPTGTLRVAINLENAVLARRNEDGEPGGVSVDLARELARQRGLPIALHPKNRAAESVAAVASGDVDLGFFAVDPARSGAGIAFTDPYVLIEGCYLVREDSPITDNAGVDQPGIRIAVGKGSAYDLFLTRHITRATLDRGTSTTQLVGYFLDNNLEVAGGIRQHLETEMKRYPGLRLLPERFMVIPQAMGVPAAHNEAVAPFLNGFLREVRANGFLAGLFAKYGITGVTLP